jgi:hypothetical protein
MRPWKILSVLVWLVSLVAGSASAAVYSRGVECSSLGSCLLTPSADENTLVLSGLTGTGLDGVKLILDRDSGHSCAFSSLWSSSDAGSSVSLEWTVDREAPSVAGSCTMQRTASGVTLSGSLWVFGGAVASSPRRVLSIQNGVVVASVVETSSGPLELLSPPGVPTQIPTVSLELDAAAHLSVCMVSCASPVAAVLNGNTVIGDQIVVIADMDGDGLLSDCRLTCATPPGADLSSVEVSSQSVTRFDHSLTAQGHLHYDGQPDVLACSVDAAGGPCSLTDGLMLLRYMFGLSGSALTQGAVGSAVHLTPDPPPAELELSRSGLFTLDPDGPGGSPAFECALTGRNTCSPDGEVARLLCHEVAHVVQIRSRFSGMCADRESVIVKRHGQVVARAAVAVDGSVSVLSPPGGPRTVVMASSGAPITKSSSNIQNNLVAPGRALRAAPASAIAPGSSSSSSVVGPDGVSLHMAFVDERAFVVGNDPPVVGDDIIFTGSDSSPVAGGMPITISGTNFTVTNTGGVTTGTLSVQTVRSSGIDQVVASIPATTAISTTHPVVDIPVELERVDSTPLRGYSVTLQLSSNLQLAGPVVESDYLSRSGLTQMFVTTNPDHSITVDCTILGPGCGPTTGGLLFTIPVSLSSFVVVPVTSSTGYVDISACEAAGCDAGPIPAEAGGKSFLAIDTSPPSALVVTTAQQTTGNDGDGTAKIVVHVTPVDAESSVELYRASFGNYPEYDDGPAPGSVPAIPSYPPPARWEKVDNTSCSSAAPSLTESCDAPSARDTWYYVAFAVDRSGNVSPVSNESSGTPDYFLGDAAGGGTPCAGDNQVTTADVSRLGSRYGVSLAVGDPDECLDWGPTVDGTVSSRPVTDHKLNFKDLILLAINYSLVSTPADAPHPMAATMDALRLRVPPVPGVGQTFEVALEMSGAGDAQGVSAQLAFDPAVVEPVAVTQGDLLAHQGRGGVVLSSQPGDVDAALLGAGPGIAGAGDLARVTFRVRANGDPGFGIASAEARDGQNRALALGGVAGPAATPAHTSLRMAFPNPFDKSTTVVLSLHQSGPASVRVFDVAGRTVRTLLAGLQPAGERTLAWDGRDDGGTRLGAGVYLLRLETAGHSETRAVRLVR